MKLHSVVKSDIDYFSIRHQNSWYDG